MLNLERFCSDHQIPFLTEGHHHTHQGWAQVHCIFCSDGNYGWHLGFNLEQGNWNCWRCGKHSTWDVVGRLLRTQDKNRIYQEIQKYDTATPNRKASKPKARKRAIKSPPGTAPLTKRHKKYLRNRGFRPMQLAKDWGLTGTEHLSGPWNWRVIIPIHNQFGEIIAFQGRTLNETTKPKYKVSDDADILEDPKGMLYGHHKAMGDSVLIVEGVTGVWKFGPGAVATLGIDWSAEQANKLRQYSKRYLMFDPEPLAQKRAEKLAKWLSMYSGTTEILEEMPCDPGDLLDEEAQEILSELDMK